MPARFFDPAALGYVPPNPEVPLNTPSLDLTVYWLGVHFPGAAGLPPLLLGKVEGPTEGAYSRFTLSYMPPDDPFGSAVVELPEWPRVNWAAHSGYQTSQELSGPCWHREQLALPHGRAQLFLGFAYAERTKPCSRRPYTLYRAHVFLGQTVIHVAVQGDTAPGALTSPYVTRAGLVALVRALQPRVPNGPVPTPVPTFGLPPIPTGQPAGLSLAQVYQRVQRAISRPGLLYHATIHITGQMGQAGAMTAYTSTITQWVDARRNVAREEQVAISATGKPLTQTRQTMLLTHEGRYLRYGPDGEVIWTSPGATTCPGATRAASAVLSSFGCPTYTGPTTVVQQGRYGGHPAIVLISSGTFCGEDECSASISRLYLDPHTFLPIAQETTGQVNAFSSQIQPMRARWVYAHTFVPAHAVPAHFFDPAAIGYVPPENQLNHVPRGFTIYWLGTHVAGVRGLPPLLLTKVDPGGAAGGGYLPILTYSRTDDRFGAPGVTLQEWPLGVVGNSPWPYGPCWAHRDITTPRWRARIFLGFENAPPPGSKSCPAPPYNRFMARVYLGQTMVTVDARPGFRPAA